jgi:hypothetical protein
MWGESCHGPLLPQHNIQRRPFGTTLRAEGITLNVIANVFPIELPTQPCWYHAESSNTGKSAWQHMVELYTLPGGNGAPLIRQFCLQLWGNGLRITPSAASLRQTPRFQKNPHARHPYVNLKRHHFAFVFLARAFDPSGNTNDSRAPTI